MRGLNMEEVKAIQVSILDVVDAFCRERGINYFLDSGTLLGAVRHKGYIPWDDDIDIGMLRPDYDRFMAGFNGWNPRYEFRCLDNDPDFPRAFGRVFDTNTLVVYDPPNGFKSCGISIDVFIYDNAPDDDRLAEEMYRARDFWTGMFFRRIYPLFGHADGNILRRMCVYALRAAMRVFPASFFVRRWAANSRRYVSYDTKRVGNFTGYDHVLCSKEAFRPFIELEFEGKMYKAPSGYDELLTQHYGDYMTPPPPEERVPRHTLTAYMKD